MIIEEGGRVREGARQCEGVMMTNVDLDDDEEEGSRFEIGGIPVLTSARQHLNI